MEITSRLIGCRTLRHSRGTVVPVRVTSDDVAGEQMTESTVELPHDRPNGRCRYRPVGQSVIRMTAPSKRTGARPPARGDAWLMLLVILLAVAVLGGLLWVVFVGVG
jgi:hypothetical protein